MAEIAVDERSWFEAAARPTKESLAGTTVGSEKVTVPAGSFTARRGVFGAAGQQRAVEFWLADSVPEGLVKMGVRGSQADAKQAAMMVLAAFGTGTVSELDSN